MRIFRPLKSSGVLQRLVGAQRLEAVVPEGQALDAAALELGEQLPADRPCGHAVQLVVVVEDEGQVEDLELLGAQRAELGQRRRQHLHRAELQRLHLFLVLVERAVGVDLDLDLAAGQLGGALGEELGKGLALGRVVGDNMAELDDQRLLGSRGKRPPGGGMRIGLPIVIGQIYLACRRST
jgi:hypothetical protein